MFKTYRYFPPLKYVLSIPLGVLGGAMFTWITFIMPEWYVKIFTVIFALLLFGYAIGFFSASFRHMRGFKIEINKRFMSLPFLMDGKKIEIEFRDMIKVERLETYEGDAIVIHSKSIKGYIELEQKWMNKKDFNNLFELLKSNIKTQLNLTE